MNGAGRGGGVTPSSVATEAPPAETIVVVAAPTARAVKSSRLCIALLSKFAAAWGSTRLCTLTMGCPFASMTPPIGGARECVSGGPILVPAASEGDDRAGQESFPRAATLTSKVMVLGCHFRLGWSYD